MNTACRSEMTYQTTAAGSPHTALIALSLGKQGGVHICARQPTREWVAGETRALFFCLARSDGKHRGNQPEIPIRSSTIREGLRAFRCHRPAHNDASAPAEHLSERQVSYKHPPLIRPRLPLF
ncbi:unnamed protein product [Pylaiella littoralis]